MYEVKCEECGLNNIVCKCREDRRSELIDLLSALKPFAEAAEGMEWESTPDHLTFWPVNSLASGNKPISAGDMRRAMKIYAKYGR